MTDQHCVIVGASHAAAQLAPSLRQEGWTGSILVVGDEPHTPYQRPPLSKGVLDDDSHPGKISIRPAAFYEKQAIEFKLGVKATTIDRINRRLMLDTGEALPYDKLALCTGARARKMTIPGHELEGICYLRTIKDAESIRNSAAPGMHALIVGGGYIGLETAAALTKQGMQVTVLEMADRVLQRVTAPAVSAFYRRIHAEQGVTIKTGVCVEGFEGEKRVQWVICSDGNRLPADLVVIGIGVEPNVEIAEAAGLQVDNGIRVDEFAITSDPDIVAAGDCTNHPCQHYGSRIRLESVPHATDQARSAAASLCGNRKRYESLPWFWSEQYDLKMQIAGLSNGYDEVILRGDPDKDRSFAAFYVRKDKLIAADCVNRPLEFMFSKRVLSADLPIDLDCLTDETIDLKSLLRKTIRT
jgi:3-phenylpropionate/trans-cinnamate dioxygenase ferredoxin reductase subunit